LSQRANEALASMKQAGVDEDVAIALLEQLLPESEMYELEDEVEDGRA
jgi:3-hydroxyisobutyrate dehydrogenase-like beta-hydroxyacid dehydrogenase